MKNIIKDYVSKIICYCGAYFIFRCLYANKYSNPIQILFAHDILDKDNELYPYKNALGDLDVIEFEKRISYLQKHYTIISLEHAVDLLKKDPCHRERNLLVLTFDDGYKSLYTNVFPIIKRFNIPITVFLTTGFIREEKTEYSTPSENLLWYDRLIYHIAICANTEIQICGDKKTSHDISSFRKKVDFIEWYCEFLKALTEVEKQKALDSLFTQLTTECSPDSADSSSFTNPIQMLSWHEVREMFSSGLVTFGAHSVTHPLLSRISLTQAKREIENSKNTIEEELGSEISTFAYPNGQNSDFNEQHIETLNSLGVNCACTTSDHGNFNLTHPMRLGRIGFDQEPWHFFVLRVCGFFELISGYKSFIYANIMNQLLSIHMPYMKRGRVMLHTGSVLWILDSVSRAFNTCLIL